MEESVALVEAALDAEEADAAAHMCTAVKGAVVQSVEVVDVEGNLGKMF